MKLMKPDKIKLLLASLIILASISWITSCTHNADVSGFPEVCFDTEVSIIFINSCAIQDCHDGNGEGMILNSYTSISREVVPGNPDESKLYKAIVSTWGENQMPPLQPLSQDNRTIIRLWIEQGAREVMCDTTIAKSDKNGSSIN